MTAPVQAIAPPQNVARLSGVPKASELGDEFSLGVGSHLYMHAMLQPVMEPTLQAGDIYCFRWLTGKDINDPIPDGTIVAAYVVTQKGDAPGGRHEEVVVCRRYFLNPQTGLISLRADNLCPQVEDICGLDSDEAIRIFDQDKDADEVSDTPAFGITVFAILDDIRPARRFVEARLDIRKKYCGGVS